MQVNDRNKFIEDNIKFITLTTEYICKRRISKQNDDEYSIALIAFNRAIDTYEETKGDFHTYAKRVIRNALIDYFRKTSNSNTFTTFTGDISSTDIDLKISLEEHNKQTDLLDKKEIITLFNKTLNEYKISMADLIKNSPSHKDTRANLIELSLKISKEPMLLSSLHRKKLLEVKYICDTFKVNRKFVEKWRRYIIAVVLILSNNDFKYIKNYLNIEEG